MKTMLAESPGEVFGYCHRSPKSIGDLISSASRARHHAIRPLSALYRIETEQEFLAQQPQPENQDGRTPLQSPVVVRGDPRIVP